MSWRSCKAGVQAHLAEPADTAALRGRKRRAKTDGPTRSTCGSCSTRPAAGVLDPARRCWRRGRCWSSTTTCGASTPAWVQRIHAVLFHQGARRWAAARLRPRAALDRRHRGEQLSPAGRLQVPAALVM